MTKKEHKAEVLKLLRKLVKAADRGEVDPQEVFAELARQQTPPSHKA